MQTFHALFAVYPDRAEIILNEIRISPVDNRPQISFACASCCFLFLNCRVHLSGSLLVFKELLHLFHGAQRFLTLVASEGKLLFFSIPLNWTTVYMYTLVRLEQAHLVHIWRACALLLGRRIVNCLMLADFGMQKRSSEPGSQI